MTEVSLRALKSTALSRGNNTKAASFDVRSWQGLTEVLQVARTVLAPQEYSEFRDLVLEYAQSGGTPELKQKIDTIIGTFKKNTVELKNETPKASLKVVSTQKISDENLVASETVDVNSPLPQQIVETELRPVSAPQKSILGVVRPSPIFKVRSNIKSEASVHIKNLQQQAQNVPLDTALPKTLPSEEVVPVQNAEVPHEIALKSESLQEVAKDRLQSIEEYKARIATIKHDVNTRFGNPVMLIDSGNNVGREYMTALLEAVKASGGGQTSVLAPLMEKLEAAYTAIQNIPVTTKHKTAIKPRLDTPVFVVDASPVPELFKQDREVQSTIASKSSPEARSTQKEPVVPIIEKIPSREEAPIIAAVPSLHDLLAMKPQRDQGAIEKPNEKSIIPEVLEDAKPNSNKVERVVPLPPAEDPLIRSTYATKPHQPSVDRAMVAGRSDMSESLEPGTFSKSEGLKNVEHAETYSMQVTEALEKLLHEWPLFKSSGLFGTGPGGGEHPLYVKLSELPMSSVLAGRWNDANPEIIKSIKDYVNAWRHEQGIAYTVNETFEEYLRRVVTKILRRQK